MALENFPDWVLAHKKPGVELRCIRGKYYAYECSSYYDKDTKQTRKKTGRYIGRITEAEGLVPRKSIPATEVSYTNGIRDGECATMEYGFYYFYINHIRDRYEPLMRKHFPDLWQSLLGASYCRAMRQAPLYRMESVFRRSYLSHVYKDAHLSPKKLTGLIRDIGRSRAAIIAFCRELLGESRTIIFDGTDILSASNLMTLNTLQKSKNGSYEILFNMMCCFSPDAGIPVFYSIHPGKIKDSKAFKDCLDELMVDKDKTMIIIDPEAGTELDKGFASGANLEKLERYKYNYVVSLRRNDKHLDYSCLESRNNAGMDVQFDYEGRPIWGKDLGPWSPEHTERRVYLFYDPLLAKMEEEDFARHNASISGTPKYKEKYAEACLRFGTIGMVSNKQLPDKKEAADGNGNQDNTSIATSATPAAPKKNNGKKNNGKKRKEEAVSLHELVYFSYKERGTDEDMIKTMKTVVEADRTYMQDEIALEGWMFINFLALLWHYIIRNHIIDHNMLSKISSSYLCETFTGVNLLRIGDNWKISGITANDQKVLKKLDLLPPIDPAFIISDKEVTGQD